MDKATYESRNVPAPNLPSITMNMLMDFLAQYKILYQPAPKKRSFRWFTAFSHKGPAHAIPASVPDANLLFVCVQSDAIALLEEKPSAFALVLADEEEPSYEQIVQRFPERAIVVLKEERFSFLLFQLQSFFTQLLIWENTMHNVIANGGSLQDLLNTATTVIGNFMFVSDDKFNMLARTTDIEPPDALHKAIVDIGCFTPSMLGEERVRLSEKTLYVKEPSSIAAYARLSWPIFLNHIYLGSLSMSCHAAPLTEGLKDLFTIMAKYVTLHCESAWRTQMRLNVPHYFFFTKMLNHEEVSDEYLRAQLELANLSEDTEYKLIVMDIDGSVETERASLVLKAAQGINNGNVFCFPYLHTLVALCYTPPSDSLLSHRKSGVDLQKRIWEPYGITSGVSEIFTGITNMDLAYRQAQIVLGLRRVIDSEQVGPTPPPERSGREGVYFFSDALSYFLVSPEGKDERFMRFCFSHNILQKMHQADQQNKTNYLALFWFYIHSGCNATETAQRLHVHRNTVLYRIDLIQKRFDFDLKDPMARDRMMLDFKFFFLTTSSEAKERIFSSEHHDEKPKGSRSSKKKTS